jgi:hypothetical protein
MIGRTDHFFARDDPTDGAIDGAIDGGMDSILMGAGLVDIEIRAPHSEYADRAQEIHIKVIHALIDSIEVGLDYTN